MRRKEIKKLWNLSENLFSPKFPTSKAPFKRRAPEESFSKLNKLSFLINFPSSGGKLQRSTRELKFIINPNAILPFRSDSLSCCVAATVEELIYSGRIFFINSSFAYD